MMLASHILTTRQYQPRHTQRWLQCLLLQCTVVSASVLSAGAASLNPGIVTIAIAIPVVWSLVNLRPPDKSGLGSAPSEVNGKAPGALMKSVLVPLQVFISQG